MEPVRGGHSVMTDNSVFVFRSILNSVFKKIKTELYLIVLLPEKFGYRLIRVRVRSWPNNMVNIINTKDRHYLLQIWQYFNYILNILIHMSSFSGRNKRATILIKCSNSTIVLWWPFNNAIIHAHHTNLEFQIVSCKIRSVRSIRLLRN